jgi:hypothetical protein
MVRESSLLKLLEQGDRKDADRHNNKDSSRKQGE